MDGIKDGKPKVEYQHRQRNHRAFASRHFAPRPSQMFFAPGTDNGCRQHQQQHKKQSIGPKKNHDLIQTHTGIDQRVRDIG